MKNKTFRGGEDTMDRKILIVDDEKNIVDIIAFNLKKEGYTVITAADGEEGVQKAMEENPDLILLDIMMPKMDGYTATREIRTLNNHKCANIPIIAMTANAFEEDRKKAVKAGMNGHIAKPISADVILENLDQIFEG